MSQMNLIKLARHVVILTSLLLISCGSSSEDYIFNFYVAEEFSNTQATTILESANIWNQLTNCRLFNNIGTLPAELNISDYDNWPTTIDIADQNSIIYLVNTENRHFNLSAITTLTAANVDIMESPDELIPLVDATIDDMHIDMLLLWDKEQWDPISLGRWITLHEFGHWLGLRHIKIEDDPNTIMVAAWNNSINRNDFSQSIPSSLDVVKINYLWNNVCNDHRIYDVDSTYNIEF